MNNLQKAIVLLITLLISPFTYGQGQGGNDGKGIGLTPDFVAEKVADIVVTPRGSKWLVLRYDSRISPRNIFEEYRAAFMFGKDDRMDLYRTEEDNLGFTHYRFQQIYQGVKVEGAEMLVHARDGYAVRTNGNIVTNLDLSIQPAISEEMALDSALNTVGAKTYRWESPEWEARIQEKKNDPNATYYPYAEVIITRTSADLEMTAVNYRMAYKFDIYTSIPQSGHSVYVDAQTSEVFKMIPLVRNQCSDGTAATLYNGSQAIKTEYRDPPDDDYILNDECRGDGIHTLRYVSASNYEDVTDDDNNWQSAQQQPSASAHWAAEMTYDYFYNAHNRNSYDNAGATISVISNFRWPYYCPYPVVCWEYDNAAWDPSIEELHLGRGGGSNASDDLVSLDIIGHEFSHAVTSYTADLEYEYESGALNESFSDIFGTMVEFYSDPTPNYLIAEDMWVPDNKMRDMSDPHTKDQPDTYGTNDSFWFDHTTCQNPSQANDYCGVHTNSGVQNFWFYLLAEGGSGTNENNDSYSVISIGRDKAAAIAYRNHTQYLWSTSDYADAREGAIWAASDLYGGLEVTQVLNAWYAVGVGASMPDNITLQNETISSDTLMYIATNTITAGPSYTIQSGQVLFFAGNSITLDPGFTASAGSRFHAVAAQGGGSPLGKVVAVAPAAQTIEEQPIADEKESLPTVYSLSHGYPNPFNPNITIPFGLPEPASTRLVVYDLLGREVVRLVDEHLEPGYHTVRWNGKSAAGREVPSGIYIARLVTPEYSRSIKMLLLK